MSEHVQYFDSKSAQRNYTIKKVISSIFLFAFITIFALIILFPFYFMVVTSFIDPDIFDQYKAADQLLVFPSWDQLSLENYAQIFADTVVNEQTGVVSERVSFAHFFINTFIVAIVSCAVTVVTSVLAGFAFARLEFKGKNLLFMFILATMMVPGEMMIVTNYQTTAEFGWLNTFCGLIFVHGVSVFYIFYLRQTFQQIPNELYLAAKVDGYGDFKYLLKVMVPIGMPTIVTITILTLMGSWNSYIWPSLIAMGNNSIFLKWFGVEWDMRLVTNGLMSIFSSDFSSRDSIKIAGSMVVTAPLFVFFLCFRKYIMRGVSRSGIKG